MIVTVAQPEELVGEPAVHPKPVPVDGHVLERVHWLDVVSGERHAILLHQPSVLVFVPQLEGGWSRRRRPHNSWYVPSSEFTCQSSPSQSLSHWQALSLSLVGSHFSLFVSLRVHSFYRITVVPIQQSQRLLRLRLQQHSQLGKLGFRIHPTLESYGALLRRHARCHGMAALQGPFTRVCEAPYAGYAGRVAAGTAVAWVVASVTLMWGRAPTRSRRSPGQSLTCVTDV